MVTDDAINTYLLKKLDLMEIVILPPIHRITHYCTKPYAMYTNLQYNLYYSALL
jgi:hypothetical protein